MYLRAGLSLWVYGNSFLVLDGPVLLWVYDSRVAYCVDVTVFIQQILYVSKLGVRYLRLVYG